jgi:hypothetical protein
MYSTKSAPANLRKAPRVRSRSDIMMRMKLVLGHLAKKPMTLEEVRTKLNTYFSDWFGKRTLNHVPSDAFRRTLLVDRMVNFVEQICAGCTSRPDDPGGWPDTTIRRGIFTKEI